MLCYPDYDRSVISIISSVMKYYRAPYEYPSLSALDRLLDKSYKNVVLLVLEGLGTEMLEHSLDNKDFLRKNFMQNLTSVFPSTTAAVMTSLVTGVSPAEHGWLGRTLFFKEFCRNIDIFSNLDAYTRQTVAVSNVAEFVMPYETVFENMKDFINEKVQPFTVTYPGANFPERGSIRKTADDIYRVCELITKIAESNQNTFTFILWKDPDETAHRTGCRSKETKDALKMINGALNMTFSKLTDTLLIVSAGHGMTDISDEYLVDRMPDVTECLIMPPFVDGRAMSFFVKPDRRTDFEKAFAAHMGHDFMLISRNDLYGRSLLGTGRVHKKTYDFIGDYMACAVSDTVLCYRTLNTKPKASSKAAHGGLTKQEMTVPLIVCETPQTSEYKPKKLI